MNYSNEFKDIVEFSVNNGINYIGKGNPNAEILIIGKELALDQNDTIAINKTSEQNALDWKINIENPNYEIEDWNENFTLFNPLIPYKGMGFNPKKPAETWRKYQSLHDNIFNKKSKTYNFYENIFITELNANPSKFSNLQEKEKRRLSIDERKNNFFNSDFTQKFPVIIVASGHYPKENDVNLCELFNVDFKGTEHVDKNPKYWYNLHRNKQGEDPKLLIHTVQLSGSIIDELLKQIANKIKSFATENKIQL
jgi:hypothetical protein